MSSDSIYSCTSSPFTLSLEPVRGGQAALFEAKPFDVVEIGSPFTLMKTEETVDRFVDPISPS